MARFASWLSGNVDVLVALILAVSIGILGLADVVGTNQISNAILLILAVVAGAMLRDRAREDSRTRRIQRALDDLAVARVLSGAEVSTELARAREDSDLWLFRGGTGTYTRAVTLPECVAKARRNKRQIRIRLSIIDPTDEDVCQRYAAFRQSLAAGPDGIGEIWTLDRARKEAFATVLAACWYRQRYSLLRIEVHLTSMMTTWRYDMSDHSLILTQEDPTIPALMFERGKLYYDLWRTDLDTMVGQGRPVAIDLAKDIALAEVPTVEETRRLFQKLNLPLPSSFGDREISEIVQKAVRPRNPYQ